MTVAPCRRATALDQLIDEFSPEGSGSEELGERPRVWHLLMRMHEGRRSDVRMAARVAPAVLGDQADFEARCRRCEGRIRQAPKERIALGAGCSGSRAARALMDGAQAEISMVMCESVQQSGRLPGCPFCDRSGHGGSSALDGHAEAPARVWL
ncbi:MAG TPA: hypothetical protein VHN80_17065 [Kineosporiaceae bacterium]|nr:hypothetical protein [Kineosporiaceae bacterium]